ncbi:MAG TPA: choice-of-anchor C family protein [Archangium sp.]|nr:choice-of-anchor C family protein [Archangium sp.]
MPWKQLGAVALQLVLGGCGGAEEPVEQQALTTPCGREQALGALVTNGDFATGPACGCGGAITPFVTLLAGDTRLSGWSILGNGVDHLGTYWTPASGPGSIDLNAGGPGGLTQTLATEAGRGYQLSFALAGNPACGDAMKWVQVSIGADWYSLGFDTTGRSLSNMGWNTIGITFGATSSSTALTFQSLTAGACGPALDNVSVTAL